MRALIITEDVKREIARVKEYAQKHVRSLDDFMKLQRGEAGPAGDDPGHVIEIPVGFRVVYSIEVLPEPYKRCHRFSVSVASNADVLPHPAAIDELLYLFGLGDGLHQMDVVLIEDTEEFKAIAVTHLSNRHLADVLETTGVLRGKDTREESLKKAGLFFDSLHDSR